VTDPAYTRLNVDERRRQVLDAGRRLFAEYAFEEISMRQIAEAAGISKPLLYHYFPSKIDLFTAAVAEHRAELERLTEPDADAPPLQQLTDSLDGYLGWIEANGTIWRKLMQSAASLPEASTLVSQFQTDTMRRISERLCGGEPPPALRNALAGWLGYIDAAILDWLAAGGLERRELRDMLLAAFGAALLAAQQTDPTLTLALA
jgi:AcrR family transcriptional regulator